MAENLARIYGTEEDKVNCPFFFKIGACRHGDRCSRTHHRPLFSQTLLIQHMYTLPPVHPQTGLPTVNEKDHLIDFAEEVIDELQNYGALEEFHVVGNLGEHMLGNVYLKYSREEEAEKALKALNGRFYGGRPLVVEFSPVSDFREARCRQYDEETCNRGAMCNFIHMRPLPSVIRKEMERIREKNRRRAERRGSSRDDRDRGSSSGRRERSRSREREHRRDDRDRSSRDDPRSSSSRGGPSTSAASAAPASSSSGRDRSPRRDAGPSSGSDPRAGQRSESEERRAKIALWNKAREEKQAAGAAAGAGRPPQQQQQ